MLRIGSIFAEARRDHYAFLQVDSGHAVEIPGF